MADHKSVDSADPTSEQLTIDELKPGKRLLGLALDIEGTTATGETLAPSDLGKLTGDLFDEQRFNTPIGFWHSHSRIHYGTVEKTLPQAGATRLALFIPMWVEGAGLSTVPITEKSVLDFDFDFDTDTLSTRFNGDGAEAEVSAIYADDVPSDYLPDFKKTALQFQAATDQGETYDGGNVPALYVREAASNTNSDIVKRVDAQADNKDLVSKLDLQKIDTASTILAETESPVEPWKFIDATSGPADAGGWRNGSVSIDVTTNAAGEVQVIRGQRVAYQ